MSSLNEYIDKGNVEHDETSIENEQMHQEKGNSFLEMLMADSPDIPIESYIEHPLNFKNSKGLARVIRGLEGMFGSLRKAIIDILVGGIEFSRETKGVKSASE